MSLLSPLAEPADNESETDGHLTRMGPRLNEYLSKFFLAQSSHGAKLLTLNYYYIITHVIVLKLVLARYSIVAENSAPSRRHV